MLTRTMTKKRTLATKRPLTMTSATLKEAETAQGPSG